MRSGESLYNLANGLVLLGFFLVFLSVIGIIVVSFLYGGETSGGVVVFIGPFPIALGWGEWGPVLILVGAIFSLLMLLEILFLTGKIGKWMIENE